MRSPSKNTIQHDKNLLRKGRGLGELADYQPFLTIRTGPSSDVSRHYCHITEREHHLFGPYEPEVFLFFHAIEALGTGWRTTDIREQFPLVPEVAPHDDPTLLTVQIAERLGVKHPTSGEKNDFVTMTTDLVFFLRCGIKSLIMAISVKKSSDLENKRVREKLEIERRYWQERKLDGQDVHWFLITDKEINLTLNKNLAFLIDKLSNLKFEPPSEPVLTRIKIDLESRLQEGKLHQIARQTDRLLGLPARTSFNTALWLIAKSIWRVDLNDGSVFDSPALNLLNNSDEYGI